VSLVALLALCVQVAASGAPQRPLRADTTEVRVVARVRPETVYVGQATQYELSVLIRDDVRRRLRRNPEYVPPELRGLVGYDFRDRDSVVRVTQNGVEYEVHRFTRTLFPVAAGAHEVAAARLTYAVPLGASFFSREETRVLRSAPVTVMAIDPPREGRPLAWDGAVGDLALSVATIPSALRRGDPFVLTIRVTGRGHIPLVPRPTLTIPWASTVASDERVQFAVVERGLRGAKEFDWLVTPTEDGALTVPAVEYPYFDPERRAYRTARTAPTAVRVAATGAPGVVEDTADPIESSPPDAPIVLRPWSRESPRLPGRVWWFWGVITLAPLPALLAWWRRRRADDRPAMGAAARLTEHATPAERRAYVHAMLAARFAAMPHPWETTDRAIALLRREGVTDTTARALVDIVVALDRCCYGAAAAPPPPVAEIRRTLAMVLREARPRSARRGRGLGLVAILLWTAGGAVQAQGAPGESARARFEAGHAVFDADPRAAADAFFAAARRAPRVTATWHNAAAASWRVSDTARAVVAWQRVVRLAPRDADARAALRRVGAWRAAPSAMVWGLPVTATAVGALLVWCGGWIILVRRPRSASAWGSLLGAAVLLGLAALQQRRLDDPRIGVIARPSPVRPLPALAADGGLLALTGEVVVVREATPVWLRIEAADGRSGWVDARDVLTLEARPWRD
jgi:hypothetical protein